MGYLSDAYRFLKDAATGGAANIQSKVSAAGGFDYLKLKGNNPAVSSLWQNTQTAKWEGTNGINCSLASRTITVDGGDWATASGSLLRSTLLGSVSELAQGSDGTVLTVDVDAVDGGGLAWTTAAASPNYYADGLGFAGGNLTVSRTAPLATLSVSLDGRYLTSQFGQAGATNYVGYFSDPTNITGTLGFQYDGTTITMSGNRITSGSLITHISGITTATPPVAYLMTTEDYHIHVINKEDPGVDQPITLPPAELGKVVTITTDGNTPLIGGTNTVTLTPDAGDNINTVVTSTILNSNGSDNYDVYKFICVAANTWAGAKMEAVV